MNGKIAKLKSLNNEKLIDVVKNYRQYGYEEKLRDAAIEILDERGIDKKQLKLTGNFENETYKYVNGVYDLYKANSKIAFTLYLSVLTLNILIPIIELKSNFITNLAVIGVLIFAIAFVVFLIKSFINLSDFFKIIESDLGSYSALIYFFLGMPFYFIVYFYYRNQMNSEMKLVK